MNVNFNLGRRESNIENATLKARSQEAKVRLLDVGLEGLDERELMLVLFDYLADGLDERARRRSPSVIVRLGPWVLGGGAFGAISTWLNSLS